tara:strand:- start:106 stop:261 length:156 start_codon:yes stop_codon:yes gene_type:complete
MINKDQKIKVLIKRVDALEKKLKVYDNILDRFETVEAFVNNIQYIDIGVKN